jgi:REP element-mobilizing transposase RayT
MSRPIVIAYHLIWTASGTWLPNDPRGSGSTMVHADVLAELGELHQGRKRVQPCGWRIRRFYDEAQPLLHHAVLTFDENARAELATAFQDVILREKFTCYACAIMPDHVHILIRKHKRSVEAMIEMLRDAGSERLRLASLRSVRHPIWSGGGGWKVFLDHPDDVRRTAAYVQDNPLPIGLPIQRWPFVTEYDGWPLHKNVSRDRSKCDAKPQAKGHPRD